MEQARHGVGAGVAASARVELAPGQVPPAAPERLEQSRGIGVAARLRLHAPEQCLLIGLLGAEQLQVAGVARLLLALHELERGAGSRLRCGGGRKRVGVMA